MINYFLKLDIKLIFFYSKTYNVLFGALLCMIISHKFLIL